MSTYKNDVSISHVVTINERKNVQWAIHRSLKFPEHKKSHECVILRL